MRIKSVLLCLSATAAFASSFATATPILVNGNFESTTNGGNKQLSSHVTDRTDRTTLAGWTSSNGNDGGYNFVLNGAIANTWDSAIWLRDNGNGYSASPGGGNVFASDALYWPGVLSQTVTGLVIGKAYTLTFDYAMAQQSGFKGVNKDNFWEVGFGKTSQNTDLLSLEDGAFSGWRTASMTFTATSVSEVLSFLAKGTAPGAPPFMLLDDVALSAAVPEPATWTMLLGGLGLLAFLARRRMGSAV
jgi:hypothetical protein